MLTTFIPDSIHKFLLQILGKISSLFPLWKKPPGRKFVYQIPPELIDEFLKFLPYKKCFQLSTTSKSRSLRILAEYRVEKFPKKGDWHIQPDSFCGRIMRFLRWKQYCVATIEFRLFSARDDPNSSLYNGEYPIHWTIDYAANSAHHPLLCQKVEEIVRDNLFLKQRTRCDFERLEKRAWINMAFLFGERFQDLVYETKQMQDGAQYRVHLFLPSLPIADTTFNAATCNALFSQNAVFSTVHYLRASPPTAAASLTIDATVAEPNLASSAPSTSAAPHSPLAQQQPAGPSPPIQPSPPAIFRRSRIAAAQSVQKEAGDHSSPGSAQDESEKRPRSTWKLGFKQPASEYVKFRETLDSQKVALENVMLKNEQSRMIGTIKVSNIAFEKRVFVRYSDDGWRTFTDKLAQYHSSPSKTFDMFRFDIEIPRNEEKGGGNQNDARLEFCVCYRSNDGGQQEYWDSNSGHNFALLSTNDSPASPLSPGGYDHNKFGGRQQPKPWPIVPVQSRLDRDDAYRMDWNSPTGFSSTHFAAWRQLSTDGPYW